MSTEKEPLAVEAVVANEENESQIELIVKEKLFQVIDIASKEIDKLSVEVSAKSIDDTSQMDKLTTNDQSSHIGFKALKDILSASVADSVTKKDGQEVEVISCGLNACMKQYCEETSELQGILDSESKYKNIDNTTNGFDKTTISVFNAFDSSEENNFSDKSDHVYTRKEPVSNKGLNNNDLQMKVIDSISPLTFSSPNDSTVQNKQSKKRKKMKPNNSLGTENGVNSDNTDVVPPPAKRKRFQPYNNKPTTLSTRCFEPFKIGWTRELVHRKTGSTETCKMSDVYYKSPEGVKLRSYRDVAEYLKTINEVNLSLDCFTYKKMLIYHPPEETERNACESSRYRCISFKKSKATVCQAKHNSKTSLSRRKINSSQTSVLKAPQSTKKVKFPKEQHLAVLSQLEKRKKEKKAVKTVIKIDSVLCSLSCPGQQGILPTLQCDICLCMFHPPCVNSTQDEISFTCIKCICCRSNKKKYGDKQIKSSIQSPERDRSFTGNPDVTESKEGEPEQSEPPILIEVSSSIISNKNKLEKIEVEPSYHVLPRLTAAPVGNKNSPNFSQTDNNRPLPPLKISPFALNHHFKPIKMSGTWTPLPQLPPRTIPLRQPPPLKMVNMMIKESNQQNTGSVILRPPPPLIDQRQTLPQSRLVMIPIPVSNLNNALQPTLVTSDIHPIASAISPSSAISASVPLRVSSVVSSGNSMSAASSNSGVVTMVNNVVINDVVMNNVGTMKFTLKTSNGNMTDVLVPEIKPSNATSPAQPKFIITDNLGKPSRLAVGFGNSILQLPILNKLKSYQHETSSGIISVPLPNPSSNVLVPKFVVPIDPVASGKKKEVTELDNKQAATAGFLKEFEKDSNSKESSTDKPLEALNSHDSPEKKDSGSAISNVQHFFVESIALLKVFEYLTHAELSRARCVCQRWKWWASQPELWKCIDLSGTCVNDWNKLADLIKKFKTTRLDLRRMKVSGDQNGIWHCFLLVLKDLETIKHIDFGYMPGAFLQPIARGLSQLKVLTAEWIHEYSHNNCRLDIGNFGNLKHLTKLRLRGVSGLQIQNITTEGICSLANLTQLVHLSITTLHDAPASDFKFIKSLKQLKELELGDCKNWETETYGYICELINLKRLRLEVGIAFPNDLLSISKLNKLVHLELNNFEINDYLIPVLGNLPQLEHLSILPYCGQNSGCTNTTIFQALQTLKNLKVLEWKILTNNSEGNNEYGRTIIKEDDACIPITLHAEDKFITIGDLSSIVKNVCSNVIFH